MGHLKIHCDSCGSDWNVYHRDSWREWRARTCPVCMASIDQTTWEQSILRGFNELEDASRELVKDHNQYHGALFTVGYEPDVIYPNSSDDVNKLREEIEELREALSEYV